MSSGLRSTTEDWWKKLVTPKEDDEIRLLREREKKTKRKKRSRGPYRKSAPVRTSVNKA